MAHSPDVETIVIGGGVIGLAIAVACAAKGQEAIVLERRSDVGQEVTSHSSEVIHAGIYYPKGSLKAMACVAGRQSLYKFATENGVATRRLGKLIVATSPSEIPALRRIQEHAQANGVDNLCWLTASEAQTFEPELTCSAALFSPTTGIVDSHALMKSFEGHLQARGGSVILKTELRMVRRAPNSSFLLEVMSGGEVSTLTARNLFVAGGLGMAVLRDALPFANGYEPPKTRFAKGHYFSLRGRAPFSHLVYPIPVEGGLGTHLTLDLQGAARFGPDVQWIDRIDYTFNDLDGKRQKDFERSIRRYWPALPEGALYPGYTGIRPKISSKGEPPADFQIHGPEQHGTPSMVVLYGIESPGLTACLALAQYSVARINTTTFSSS